MSTPRAGTSSPSSSSAPSRAGCPTSNPATAWRPRVSSLSSTPRWRRPSVKTTPPVVPGAYIPMPWAPPLPRWERGLPRTRYGGWGEGEAGAAQQLADIIRQETHDGRDIARFFIDVMEGTRTGFNQRFRFAAALVLINRGYDVVAALCPDTAAHAPQPAPYPDTQHAPDPAPETTWSWKQEWTDFEYPKDHTYDFDSYGEDDFDRDVYGDKARVHIFGDDETASVANHAVLDYKVDQIEAQRAAVHSEHDTCQPSDPLPELSGPRSPRRRLLRPAQLRLQRPRLHIRRQGRGQGRLHSRNGPQEGARPPRRRRCPRPRRPGPQPPRQRSRPPGPYRAIGAGFKPAFPARAASCCRGGFQTRLPWPSDAETRHNRPIPSPLTRPLHNRHTGEGRYPDGRVLS